MEARLLHVAMLAAIIGSLGASYRTENFIVTSSSPEFSREVAESAERFRRDLAQEWLGEELPRWREPCPITVHTGRMGAGGATSFMFTNGQPGGWSMTIQGSRIRILDSVLPHEVTHTIFATHFGRPLPRWADEGACTTVEHDSEKDRQKHMLVEFLTTGRGIAFNRMFAMKEYPRDIMPLYSQGYSLARFLIAQGGKQKFVQYVGEGMQSNNWPLATKRHYAFEDLSDLQVTWLEWVRQGSPQIRPRNTLVAQQENAAAGGSGPETAPLNQVASRAQATQPATTRAAALPANAESATVAAATQLASASTTRANGGWYARVRDDAKSDSPHTPDATRSSPASNTPPAQTASQPAVHNRSLSRQQPRGEPRQTILEWSRDQRRPAPAFSKPAPQRARQPQAYLVSPEQLRGQIRR